MRIFAALVPDEPFMGGVAGLKSMLEDSGVDLRWTRPEGWHFTLAFLGELTEQETEAVAAAFPRAIQGQGSYPLSTRGILALPERGRIRVVAAALDGGASETKRLAARCADLFEAALRREGPSSIQARRGGVERKYLPHLTLGRAWERRQAPEQLREALKSIDGQAAGLGKKVTLFRSELGRGGSRYFPLLEYELPLKADGGADARR